MVRFFKGKVPAESDFSSQQEKLRSMSGDVLRRYQHELDAEVSDPARLALVYGDSFAKAGAKRQAGVVTKMATNMLNAPNGAVNVVREAGQMSVALVKDYDIADGDYVWPTAESYCKHVISTGRELAIDNAAVHPLVCDTHLAMDGIVISYLGVPVANRDGIIIGTLCVWDTKVRDWGAADVGILTQLSMVLTRALS